MERMTRRTAMAMGALPVLGAAAAYAGGEHWLRDDAGGRPRFARTDAGSARAALQQRDLPNVRCSRATATASASTTTS